MVSTLRRHDPTLVEMVAGDGAVIVSPGLQGRLFCRLDNELVHRLDKERLTSPSDTEFDNLGGNSLWPAPEGGPFAFNYLPDSDEWVVQDGIAKVNPSVVSREPTSVSIEKTVTLTNRNGRDVKTRFRRLITVMSADDDIRAHDLAQIGYACEDSFEPLDNYRRDDVLLAAWSLEQFPGGDGVVAFAKAARPREAVNLDFYGEPETDIQYAANMLRIELGGQAKWQMGLTVSSRPELIGALDRKRDLLLLRRTPVQEGIYFNIADNDQPRGPYSAADMYSIFNGGALDFFELETIAPMQLRQPDLVGPSRLLTETTILKGREQQLTAYLFDRFQLRL